MLNYLKALTIDLYNKVTSKTKIYINDRRLDGKVVVLTGASRGIGREILLNLIERGVKVFFPIYSL